MQKKAVPSHYYKYVSKCKVTVLVVTTISMIFALSMDGKVLAQDNNVVTQPGYLLTVDVPSHPFGTSTIGISITTENGYTDQANIPTAGNPSWTFNVPPDQGNSVQVCVNSGALSQENCHIYKTTGSAMSVALPALSGSSSASSNNNSNDNNNDNNKSHHHDSSGSTSNDNSHDNNHSNRHNSATDNSNDNGGGSSHGQHGTNRHMEFGSNTGFNGNQGSSSNGVSSTGSDTHRGNSHQGFGGSDNDSLGSNSHHNGSNSNTNNNPGVPMVQFIGPTP